MTAKQKVKDTLEHVVTFRDVVIALAPIALLALWAWSTLKGTAIAEAASAVVRVEKVEKDLADSKTNVTQNIGALRGEIQTMREEIAAGRNDTRSVYQYLLTKQPQPELETPAVVKDHPGE